MTKTEKIVEFMKQVLGDEKSASTLVREWLISSLERWAMTASISSLKPFDAEFAADRPFSELLVGFLEELIEQEDDKEGCSLLIRVSLADCLDQFISMNSFWGERIDGNGPNDVAHLNETLVETFKSLQFFDNARALRWASLALKDAVYESGFLSQSPIPFPVGIYQAVERKVANTEARCEFFSSMYHWAERNTQVGRVYALFPDLFMLRLQSIYGAKRGEQQFDVLATAFDPKRTLALAPIDAVDGALAQDTEMYDDESVIVEYAERLAAVTLVNVAGHIRELDADTKRRWLKSEVLRTAFAQPLSTPPVPVCEQVLEVPETGEGSALDLIMRGVANG